MVDGRLLVEELKWLKLILHIRLALHRLFMHNIQVVQEVEVLLHCLQQLKPMAVFLVPLLTMQMEALVVQLPRHQMQLLHILKQDGGRLQAEELTEEKRGRHILQVQQRRFMRNLVLLKAHIMQLKGGQRALLQHQDLLVAILRQEMLLYMPHEKLKEQLFM